jgi:hypothetical protein
MKPPHQPHPFKAGQILQRRFVSTIRQELEDAPRLIRFNRLVWSMELQRLSRADVPNRPEGEGLVQCLASKRHRSVEVYAEFIVQLLR